MNERYKWPLITVGVFSIILAINASLTNQFTGAGVLMIASGIGFGILYRGK